MTNDQPEMRTAEPRRLGRFGLVQLAAFLMAGIIISAAGYLAGTTILRAQDREGRAHAHLLELVAARDVLRVEETRVWKLTAEGKSPLRRGLVASFASNWSKLARIGAAEEADPRPLPGSRSRGRPGRDRASWSPSREGRGSARRERRVDTRCPPCAL